MGYISYSFPLTAREIPIKSSRESELFGQEDAPQAEELRIDCCDIETFEFVIVDGPHHKSDIRLFHFKYSWKN